MILTKKAQRLFGLVIVVITVPVIFSLAMWKEKTYYESALASSENPHCGIVAVATICSLKGIDATVAEVAQYTGEKDRGVNLESCLKALRTLGVECDLVEFRSAVDLPAGVPILAVLPTRLFYHAVVIIRRGQEVILIDGPHHRRIPVRQLDSMAKRIAIVTR